MLVLTVLLSLCGFYYTSNVAAAEGSWLSGWANRVKLTVDHTRVPSTLNDMPVLINLSSTAGISKTDSTFVISALENIAIVRRLLSLPPMAYQNAM
jgi:hypothetical protein